jgi:hypothetical protein
MKRLFYPSFVFAAGYPLFFAIFFRFRGKTTAEYINSKSEIRNPKQIQNSKFQNSKLKQVHELEGDGDW